MFKKILIANRGEIALRILRTCKKLGIKSVVIYSTSDIESSHVKMADESICIGPPQLSLSYLNIPSIISAAELTNSDAIHPGYGLLSENADFVERVKKSGFTFIGPSPQAIKKMGDKISARKIAQKLGLYIIPGTDNTPEDQYQLLKEAEYIGYPLLIKASSGGGGKGMRVVPNPSCLLDLILITQEEIQKSFGNKQIYLEKLLHAPRHIEIQIIADKYSNILYLGNRECSVQRRYQKIIEEAPAPFFDEKLAYQAYQKCQKICKEINYYGLGTFEFLYENDTLFFIEMNTRLQVEHTVTEEITGLDLIEQQIRIASGEPLSIKQDDIKFTGHALECRINSEDPIHFRPSPGKIEIYHPPGGPGIRVDSHLYSGYTISPYYDPLIAKLVTYDLTRTYALNRMKYALQEIIIEGIETNIPLHQKIMNSPDFCNSPIHTKYLDHLLSEWKESNK